MSIHYFQNIGNALYIDGKINKTFFTFCLTSYIQGVILPLKQTTTHTNPDNTMAKVYNITTRGSEITTESDLDTFKKVFAQRGAKNINIFNSRINPENKQIRFELNGHDFSATAELIK